MSLLTEVEALANGDPLCVVAKWESKLSAADAAELDEVMDSTLPLNTIYGALAKRGRVPYSAATFARHYAPARGNQRRCGCHS